MNDEATLTQFDNLLKDDADVAAIVIRERLRPVQGLRGVFFPPTFAGIGQGRKSNYQIDEIGPRAKDPEGAARDVVIANRCTIDSVPSQANRLESRLLKYSGTSIPKVTISGSRVGKHALDLLEIGHRVGDAVLRYTADNGFEQFEKALRAFVGGDAAPLARLAPTSLVFGHWDSRPSATSKATKSKARRLVRSEIVAYNVARVTKRSQYWSSIDPEVNEELGEILAEAKEAASRDPETKNPASQLGMTDVPAPESPGGVIAFGPIERTSIISLSGLRALAAFANPPKTDAPGETSNEPSVDPNQTLALRRYLFALALASIAGTGIWDLREGCILVKNGKPPTGDLHDGEAPMTSVLVDYAGDEKSFAMPEDVDTYLKAAAGAFFSGGLPTIPELTFNPADARDAVEAQRGGITGEPRNKNQLIKALIAFPEHAAQEAEFKKKKWSKDKLLELWRSKQAGVGDQQAGPDADNSSADPDAT